MSKSYLITAKLKVNILISTPIKIIVILNLIFLSFIEDCSRKFHCKSENKCIDRSKVCNKQNDCLDQSDELFCGKLRIKACLFWYKANNWKI